jgi:effector-binding domain-containing protein
MSYVIEVRRTRSRPYVGIRKHVGPMKMAAAMAEILPLVAAFLKEKGIATDGPPIALYHGHDDARGEFDFQPAYFVTKDVPPEGPFTSGRTPSGEIAVTVHEGTYARLGEAHMALASWIRRQSRTTVPPCWDVYVTDPKTVTSPAELRTEVVWPLR